MGQGRDYLKWHEHYDDPESGLSWRLRTVQKHLHDVLDRCPGPVPGRLFTFLR
jgi:hypothetical protein